MSAKSRASLTLKATTSLDPEAALAVVKAATEQARGSGTAGLTSGLWNAGARAYVETEQPGRLELSINSAKRVMELCTFSAVTTAAGDSTELRVGGLESYKTSQSKVLGFIPSGPKQIAGMSLYKNFLNQIAAGLRQADAAAQVSIAPTVV